MPEDWHQVGRPQPASADALLQEASKSRADVTGEAAWVRASVRRRVVTPAAAVAASLSPPAHSARPPPLLQGSAGVWRAGGLLGTSRGLLNT